MVQKSVCGSEEYIDRELTEDPDFFRHLSLENLPKDFPVQSDWVIKNNNNKKKIY